jgi:hypothetical protein
MAQKGLEAVPDVSIDPAGRFKYILIDVAAKEDGRKFIVRGFAKCPFHGEIDYFFSVQYRDLVSVQNDVSVIEAETLTVFLLKSCHNK